MNWSLSPYAAIVAADAVLVDLDGCFLCGNALAEGAREMYEVVGDRLFVVSNNSTMTAEEMATVLTDYGVSIPSEQILLAGAFMVDRTAQQYPGANTYMMAGRALRQYASEQGLHSCDEWENNIDVVLLARDVDLCYDRLVIASKLLHAGVPLLAANPDFSHPDKDGCPVPETGSLLSALRRIVPEVKPVVIGKPEPLLFEEALRRGGCSPHNAVMIGDNPETDLAGAARLGIPTYLIGSNQAAVAPNIQGLLSLGTTVAPAWNSPETPLASFDSPGLSAVLLKALENLGEAFVIWDHQDRLVHCNPKYSQFFDEPGIVVPGVTFNDLVEFNIEKNTVQAVVLDDVLYSGIRLTPELYRKIRINFHRAGDGLLHDQVADGRWMQIRESRIPGGGVVGIYTDITARKEAEQQLAIAKQEADEANMAKSRFLAAASHDLRQPLHAVGIFLSALGGHLETQESKELLHHVEECLKTTNNLFNSLLDISKLDAGVLQPQCCPCSLKDLFNAMKREFKPLAESKGLKFLVIMTDTYVNSDPEMLGRIVRNLLSNAVKYTDSGTIHLHTRVVGEKLRLEVKDTGRGIRDDDVSLIFEEFQQVDESETKNQGLGLGLSIAARLARLLGHSIQVQSSVGRGSCFCLTMDYAKPDIEHPKKIRNIPGDVNNMVLKGMNILVVDDDRDIANASARLFKQWGCGVKTVENYAAFSELIERKSWYPDLLVVDYHLGGRENGGDVVSLAKDRLRPDIPLIIVTGDTAPERLKELKKLGCPVLHKPLQPMKLRALFQSFAGSVLD